MEISIQRMVSDVSRPPARGVAATEHTTQGFPIPPSAIGEGQMGSEPTFKAKGGSMAPHKVLIVEDNDAVRLMLHQGLQSDEFEVVAASNVRDALKLIATEPFDVLLSDLHMPSAGDGFTLVSAMRHTNPDALTVILSGYPAVEEAMAAILSQADEIFEKPIRIGALRELIRGRLADPHTKTKRVKPESVASILERETQDTIQNWLGAVDQDAELVCIPMSHSERTGHLPRLLRDVVIRLRLDFGSPVPVSVAAREHGQLRLQQGYTARMVVEESRILQVSIFSTLQRNLSTVDFSHLLPDVVTIADEVDSQLKEAMTCYVTLSATKPGPVRLAG